MEMMTVVAEGVKEEEKKTVTTTTVMKEVHVRFRGTKLLSGSPILCQNKANVTEDFMHQFTILNEILVKGNPYVEFTDPPSSSSNAALEEENGDYRRPQAATSSLLSAYGKDLVTQTKKFPDKLLTTLDPMNMPVNCVLDMWLWLDVQKYFTFVSSATHDINALQLLDIGYEKLTKRWFRPIEDEDNGLTDCDETSSASSHNHGPIHFIDLADKIEFTRKAISQFQQSSFEGLFSAELGNDITSTGNNTQKLSIDGIQSIDEMIRKLENDLLSNNMQTNMHIRQLRKRHADSPTFWQEHEKAMRDNMVDGMTVKRYMKLNKKQRMFKRSSNSEKINPETTSTSTPMISSP